MIDVHAHCVPHALFRALRADGRRYGVEVDGARVTFPAEGRTVTVLDSLFDIDTRLDAMDRTGVAIQVMSGFVDLSADRRAPGAAGYARLANEALADVVRGHPDRFRALATVPVDDPRHAAAELVYAVGTLGMVGAQISAAPVSRALDELDELWHAAAGLGCLILVHPDQGTDRGQPYLLGNVVGNPAQTTAAAARMIFSGVFDRHPGLRVCLAHGGGFLPYQIGRLDRAHAAYGGEFGATLVEPPSAYLSRLYYDTLLHDPGLLGVLATRVGTSRLLAGTDHPFPMGDPDPGATILAIPGLADDDRRAILTGNAERALSRR